MMFAVLIAAARGTEDTTLCTSYVGPVRVGSTYGTRCELEEIPNPITVEAICSAATENNRCCEISTLSHTPDSQCFANFDHVATLRCGQEIHTYNEVFNNDDGSWREYTVSSVCCPGGPCSAEPTNTCEEHVFFEDIYMMCEGMSAASRDESSDADFICQAATPNYSCCFTRFDVYGGTSHGPRCYENFEASGYNHECDVSAPMRFSVSDSTEIKCQGELLDGTRACLDYNDSPDDCNNHFGYDNYADTNYQCVYNVGCEPSFEPCAAVDVDETSFDCSERFGVCPSEYSWKIVTTNNIRRGHCETKAGDWFTPTSPHEACTMAQGPFQCCSVTPSGSCTDVAFNQCDDTWCLTLAPLTTTLAGDKTSTVSDFDDCPDSTALSTTTTITDGTEHKKVECADGEKKLRFTDACCLAHGGFQCCEQLAWTTVCYDLKESKCNAQKTWCDTAKTESPDCTLVTTTSPSLAATSAPTSTTPSPPTSAPLTSAPGGGDGGLSTGAVAGIVSGSVVVVGLGGYAIYTLGLYGFIKPRYH